MIQHSEKIWFLLIGLTLVSTWLAETGHAGWPLTLTVALLIGFKGGMVIDHYMELRFAHARFRRIFFIFLGLTVFMVIFSHGWGDFLRELTTIS
ncbi:MAG: cytochrome C oxidase subunit IV family protein [Candidatus Polarisedimenticolaceae bacterium]|nr:cytochrome C oxidase subunit IV family protein [Candidatus Polarisedimenticolaceae bacterium]